MKKLVLVMIAVLFCSLISAQSAFGPINWGMTKKEVLTAAKGAEGFTVSLGVVQYQLFGHYYQLELMFDANGGLDEITMFNKTGKTWASCWNTSMRKSYPEYNEVSLKNDVENLISAYNQKYGEPIFTQGYIHPGFLTNNTKTVVSQWKTTDKWIELYEVYESAITYPLIKMVEPKKGDLTIKRQTQKIENQTQKAINVL